MHQVTPTGWEALFVHTTREGGQRVISRTVESWDEEGYALVVEEKGGRLRRAVSYSNFHTLRSLAGRPGTSSDDDQTATRALGETVPVPAQ
ncbi:hypothetical protein [Allostreptomyces psammosilenae]|uniref:Uncharacterized protein n=1 Tax=Allostreptomyces psammosilenae TaxID=1892865 RepID=A0A853A2P0_9ACTN|nr:hypothetical protein [Allostreptomyces psammosilenae]NYI05011.1 hypothetical protein [Allostreptomyces psammosilenae]